MENDSNIFNLEINESNTSNDNIILFLDIDEDGTVKTIKPVFEENL